MSTARYAEIEMMLMNAAREHLLGIFPTESSSYCEQAAVKRDWRRFARVIDGAGRLRDLVAMEVTHQGKDVALIADLKGKVKKHGSKRRFSCGFIAVARSNDMHVYEGDTSDGDETSTSEEDGSPSPSPLLPAMPLRVPTVTATLPAASSACAL